MKGDNGMTANAETPAGSAVDVAWLRLGGPEGEDTRNIILTPEIRAERAARGRATMAARSYSTGFRVGDQVTTDCPRSKRFHHRHGWVVTTNLGEVGVGFSPKGDTEAWFAPTELSHR